MKFNVDSYLDLLTESNRYKCIRKHLAYNCIRKHIFSFPPELTLCFEVAVLI